jgi:hypothetical protein
MLEAGQGESGQFTHWGVGTLLFDGWRVAMDRFRFKVYRYFTLKIVMRHNTSDGNGSK